MNSMKIVIKLAVMLVFVGSNFVWADDGGRQSELVKLAPYSEDVFSSTRVITEREFEGTDPISISINQTLVIPIYYHPSVISNNGYSLFFGPDNSSLMSVITAGITPSDGGCLNLNLLCTGLKAGPVTIVFGEAGQIKKSFSIQVTE